MPDIGLIELILIGGLAFLVLGPERLPDFFSQIAGFVRQIKSWIADLKHQFDQEKKQLIEPAQRAKQDVTDSMQQGSDEMNLAVKAIKRK